MERLKGLTSGQLKILAVITMFLDHLPKMVQINEMFNFLIFIGRLSFPIFCFLLVEGFIHTKNAKQYAIRLGIFGLISEIPFDLAGDHINKLNPVSFFQETNVFYTLFIGFCLLTAIKKLDEKLGPSILVITIGYIAAELLTTDYAGGGVLLIACFYLTRGNKLATFISMAAVELLVLSGINPIGLLALIPIWLYNGQKGFSLKYFFYIFYPLHILLLYVLNLYLAGVI